MRLCVAVVLLASFVYADVQQSASHSAYGYISNYGIPRAEEIKKAEQSIQSRIVGGVPAAEGQYPSQAGLIGDVIGLAGQTICGATLISESRLLTAAHCWNDGVNQAWRFTIVLGSNYLFTGGTRLVSSVVYVHPSYSIILARNDVAIIYLSAAVSTSNVIAPASLPAGVDLTNDFAGTSAIAVGYGLTADDAPITVTQSLSYVRVNVITNNACSYAFPLIIQYSHVCTSGIGSVGTCSGDSGGPLFVEQSGRTILIGVSSFVSSLGCQVSFPSGFSRVSAFIDFIESHM